MQTHLTFNDTGKLEASHHLWDSSNLERSQIYTRPEVVHFMLDCIGLKSNGQSAANPFDSVRFLEPSCGEGEFVIPFVKRLIGSFKSKPTVEQLLNSLLAVDVSDRSIAVSKTKVTCLLADSGFTNKDIDRLLDNWFLTADFLLSDIQGKFTHIIGNPPYVRVEKIPKSLLKRYRNQFSTMTDRADLYVPFFEKALSLLDTSGTLSFICTDRWTKNTYGRYLRQLISNSYSLDLFIDLYETEAFTSDVLTYPAITQISQRNSQETVFLKGSSFSNQESADILNALDGKPSNITPITALTNDQKPWLVESSERRSLIKTIEDNFPLLEAAGCTVYIGAATGANKIYIVDREMVDIEPSRLLRAITARDLRSGSIKWSKKYLVNTYDCNGVVKLNQYPKLANYLEDNKEQLVRRHVAKKSPSHWFKTIDRVYENRSKMEKLLIPDISDRLVVLYDKGDYHPTNSIYYICSNQWNLHALRTVLLSKVTKLFIEAYSTKIAKGYLRFQAQHLRKLRLPSWDTIDAQLQLDMIEAGKSNDTNKYTSLTSQMYGLDKDQILLLED